VTLPTLAIALATVTLPVVVIPSPSGEGSLPRGFHFYQRGKEYTHASGIPPGIYSIPTGTQSLLALDMTAGVLTSRAARNALDCPGDRLPSGHCHPEPIWGGIPAARLVFLPARAIKLLFIRDTTWDI
jgi:hypothetical protein